MLDKDVHESVNDEVVEFSKGEFEEMKLNHKEYSAYRKDIAVSVLH